MNTNSKHLSIYTVIMLIGTAIAVTLRSIACINSLDSTSGYFQKGSLTAISDPIILITVLGSLTFIFAASRVKLRASFSTAATYIPTGILGVSTLFLGVRVLTHMIESNSSYPFLSAKTFTTPSFVISIIVFVLSLVSVGYFFFNAYSTESKEEIRALFAVATIAFFALYAMLIYFDTSLPINNPGKILNQVAFLFAAVFFLYEARISLGREMWRAYCAFGLAAAALCAYSSIPALISYYVKGTVIFGSHANAFISIEEYMLTFALFIFILSKLILTVNLKEEKENEHIKAMAEYADTRNREVSESFARFQEMFASKQLSIFDLYGSDDIEEETDDGTEISDEAPIDEGPKEIMISDDVIYEAIFGKMPEKDEHEEDTRAEEESSEKADPEQEKDERDPETIANDLLSAIDKAEKADKEEK